MYILFALAVLAMLVPVVYAKFRPVDNKKSGKRILMTGIAAFFGTIVALSVVTFAGNPAAAEEAAQTAATVGQTGIAAGLAFLGAGLVTMGSCIGSGIAVASAATAALGAISEDGSLFGKSLIFVALAEAISLYGVLISILILNKV